MLKKILIILGILLVAILIFLLAFGNSNKKDNGLTYIKVEKGNIVDKALAVGKIDPVQEVAVKSKISGIVKKIYVEMGDKVKAGDPLLEISPDPTPLEYAEAKRAVEIAGVGFDNAQKEFDRVKSLKEKNLVSESSYDLSYKNYTEARLKLELEQERLALVEKGKTEIADRKIESIIRSPISGTVLERKVNEGDPVVPLTAYQAGTELLTLAHLGDLIFKGTLDEIDVGKVREGMEANIKIGALPDQVIKGVVYKISPKARKEENTILFDIEIKLLLTGEVKLRAGYSANADIIIKQKNEVLVIPERLVEFKADTAFVEVKGSDNQTLKKQVKTGLSDGLNLEIVEGLKEGESIVERPPKEIK